MVNQKFFSLNRNTDICVDVKTFLREDSITQVGKCYSGVLTRDEEDHYQFVETLPATSIKRNPHLYNGHHITATIKDDGSLRLNFKPLKVKANFNIDSYAISVCNEIREALSGLLEK